MSHLFSRYVKTPARVVLRATTTERLIANAFHLSYYHAPDSWKANRFLGVPIQQCPLDLHTYQEVLFDVRPNFVLQTGVFDGGSLLYYASLLDLMAAPESAVVVGIDIAISASARSLTHPRIRLLEGSSVDPTIVTNVRDLLPTAKGLVVLDSDHSMKHVSSEMQIYKSFVDLGSFLVVEDTNLNGHPVHPKFGPGPSEAVNAFLATSDDFVRDDQVWKRQKLSFHQGGWLRRVR